MCWGAANLGELGGTHVVVSGDSGGDNVSIALAVAIKARRDGWLDHIAGVYAQFPWVISGAYQAPPDELPSLREFDGYFFGWALLSLQAEVYDPGSAHGMDPLCWPGRADGEDLPGLPPHVISVNELTLRDEGLAYYRNLGRASVSTIGRMVAGTSQSTSERRSLMCTPPPSETSPASRTRSHSLGLLTPSDVIGVVP